MNDKILEEGELTFVHPIRHPVVNGPDDPGVRDLIVEGHFRFRPVIDVVLVHVDQSVAAWRPRCQLKKNRIVPRQRALRSGGIKSKFSFFDFWIFGSKDFVRERRSIVLREEWIG